MNNIVDYLIHRPVAVSMVLVAFMVVGVLAMVNIPVSLLPDIDVPQITVQVSCPGSSARQIDEQLVTPLRQRLSQLPGLEDLESESKADIANIRLKFAYGSDIDLAFIDVNEKVDMAMGVFPKDAERPKVIKSSVTDIPAFFIDMTLKGEFSSKKFVEMSDFAQNVVRKRLEQLPQIAMVDISGITSKKVIVVPNYDKMKALGLTIDDLEDALSANDVSMESLSMRDGQYKYDISFDSHLLSAKDIANLRLAVGGRIISVDDICTIATMEGFADGIVRHDGKRAVTMAVIKQTEARMDDLRQSVSIAVDDLRQQYPEIEFSVSRDQTELLDFSISNLKSNLWTSMALTCLVLFLFMHGWRPALLVSLTIPVSLVLTTLFFHATGISFNVISLSGLILGVGMIVDNSIIVTDNIVQKWNTGLPLGMAIPKAASEVFTPMLSSVLTTCSVFVPLIFISGMAGDLFFDQSIGISISLIVSLALAVLVVPVYYCMMYNKKTKPRFPDTKLDKALTCLYERGMAFTLRHGRLVAVAFVMALPGLMAMYLLIDKKRLPEVTQTDAQALVNWNEGVTTEENDHRLTTLAKAAAANSQSISTLAGIQRFILSHTPDITTSEGLAYIHCGTADSMQSALSAMRKLAVSLYPKASLTFKPISNPFDLIMSNDESTLKLKFHDGKGQMPSSDKAYAITDSLRKAFPEVDLPNVNVVNILIGKVDLWKMAVYSISYSDLLQRLKELTGENKVMAINDGSLQVPVVIGSKFADKDLIFSSTITNKQGVSVPINYIVEGIDATDYKSVCSSVNNKYFAIAINCDKRSAEGIMDYAKNLTKSDSDLLVDFGGSYFSSRQLVDELLVVLAVALALLFFIMAAQFESLVQPLIILSEIATDCFVVFAVMWAIGMSLNLMSMIGIVVMSGIVINDSILKIDTINRLRREGLPTLRAIITAGHERLRPILMTSITTMLAVVPFLSRGDIGSDLQYPISITTIVGMSVGTLVSLFFVPLFYFIIYRKR